MKYTFHTLPTKAKNVLLRAGIATQEAMNGLTEQQILKMPLATRGTVKAVMQAKSFEAKAAPAQHVFVAKKLELITDWLNWQHVALTDGLRSVADAEKLYDYWQKTPDLPEFADCEGDDLDVDTTHQHHINAIGYSPLV